MSRKIKCRNAAHVERTDSCHVYGSRWYCFGCGASGRLDGTEAASPAEDQEPEDLSDAYEYIESLPLSDVRGLRLPSDARGYFVCWPDRDYYKRRFWRGEPKYVGAKGHAKPLFWARRGGERLLLCEGEINALSLAEALPFAVASAGGVGDFTSRRLEKHYPQLQTYARITVIVDNDPPGAIAAIEALGYLRARGHQVDYILMDPDANDVLVSQGKTALKDFVEGRLGGVVEESPI